MLVHEMAKFLGVSRARVVQKVNQGHFPNAHRCECGHAIVIPDSDLWSSLSSDDKPDRRKAKWRDSAMYAPKDKLK